MNDILKVDKKKASEIIETRQPLGSFYVEYKNSFVGIDNTTGDSFVEEFKDKETCMKWLSDGSFIYHTETDYGKTLDELKKEQEIEVDSDSFEVVITEELVTAVNVSAKSKEDALEKVMKMYDNEKIVLTYEDFNDVSFKANRHS
jgi:hypothetical protein